MIYLLVILAAICNAMMDTLSHHFHASVFSDLNPKFWNPNISYKYAKFFPYTKYRVDAWHLAKSTMIVLLISLLACNVITFWWLDIIICGLLWNGTFNLFYNKLF